MAKKKPDGVSDATGRLFSADLNEAPKELLADILAPAKASSRKKAKPADLKPHYLDHRERLRERFRASGPGAFQDYDFWS